MSGNQACHTKLRDQHRVAQVVIKASLNREAILDRWPVCLCKTPRGTGRFYGLAAWVRVFRLEACLFCNLLIRVGKR